MFSRAMQGLRLWRKEVWKAVALTAIAAATCTGTALADTTPVPTTTAPTTTAATTTAATTTAAATAPVTVPTATDPATTAVDTTVSTAPTTTTATITTTPDTAPASLPRGPATGPPCAGAGTLLLLVPHEAPRLLGPAVSARTPSGVGETTFQYPANGSVVRGVALRADVSGCINGGEPKTVASTVRSLSLFGGVVRATRVTASLAHPSATGTGWRLQVLVKGLRVNGRRVLLPRGALLKVGRWGRLLLDGSHISPTSPRGLGWWRAGLELRFLEPHAGLPAGTELLIAYVASDKPFAAVAPHAKPHRAKQLIAGAPLTVTPPLHGGPYVFPVAGEVGFSDTYAAARSDVPGGWHHGDDLFSGLGSPVLAVADGIVFSVGWNKLGGWRLWLRDREGNEFYYAHLSGYTRLARNGDKVRAGQPLAFVGNTGDAITTPHHLHFEIHPVGLLRLGYDGAVDPTTYLNTWKHLGRVAPLAPVRLPAGAALHGDGAVSDYRQLLLVRGLLPVREKRGVHAVPNLLDPAQPLVPELTVVPVVVAQSPRARWTSALVAALAAFLSVAALLLRSRIGALHRGLRSRVALRQEKHHTTT